MRTIYFVPALQKYWLSVCGCSCNTNTLASSALSEIALHASLVSLHTGFFSGTFQALHLRMAFSLCLGTVCSLAGPSPRTSAFVFKPLTPSNIKFRDVSSRGFLGGFFGKSTTPPKPTAPVPKPGFSLPRTCLKTCEQ